MAYQNIGTPRFFIDNYMYLRALGLDPQAYIDETADTNNLGNVAFITPLDSENTFNLSPEISKQFVSLTNDGLPRQTLRFFIPCSEMVRGMDFSGNMKWYGAILNHNLGDCNTTLHGSMFHGAVQNETIIDPATGEVIGQSYLANDTQYETILNIADGNSYTEQNNGSSIWTSDNVPTDERFTGFRIHGDENETDLSNFQVGAISMGVMYTMPVSPDLKLTMEIDFDGYDEVKTIGGSTLTNIRQTGAPVWNNDTKYNSPFSVGDFSDSQYLGGAKRNGRRSWSLKFTYISDSDIFASNYMNTNHLENDASNYDDADKNETDDAFEYNMFTDDSFMAQVWNKTLGGALPFIFQPDSNNDNPDQFCIAKFDMDTLSVKQVAFKTYNIAVKIREVW